MLVSLFSLEREEKHLLATNFVGVASYTILIYDHFLTFGEEFDYIWKGHKGLIIYLFFLNRYLFPLAFVGNLYAYLSSEFDPGLCQHFVRYEGSCIVVGLAIAGLMMILRVNAMYGGSHYIQCFLGVLWVIQIAVYSWFLARGIPVPRSLGSKGCSMIFSSRDGGLASLSSVIPLLFDTAILALTIYKTRRAFGYKSGTLTNTLFRDGVLYYGVIFSSNLALSIMILTAPPGIKNILGQFAEVMTVTMLSRITLHLKKTGKTASVVYVDDRHSHRPPSGSDTGRSDNSERRLIEPSFVHNPLDSVFSMTRSFDVKVASPRSCKGKEPEARYNIQTSSEYQQSSFASIGSAMNGNSISYTRTPEMNIRRRESGNSILDTSLSTPNYMYIHSSRQQV